MRKQLIIYLGIYICLYTIALAGAIITQPTLFSNFLGLLSVMLYIGSLLPGMISSMLPNVRRNPTIVMLLRHRRFLGVSAFLLALNHGVLQFVKQDISLLESSTYIHYFQGLTMITIMTCLALTSSDESVKALKKKWKNIHKLTYFIPFLLPWHIFDKMSGHWSFVTPVAVLLSITTTALFFLRFYQEKFHFF
jgi:methionine sulfoxide reductase heme-binding subunit